MSISIKKIRTFIELLERMRMNAAHRWRSSIRDEGVEFVHLALELSGAGVATAKFSSIGFSNMKVALEKLNSARALMVGSNDAADDTVKAIDEAIRELCAVMALDIVAQIAAEDPPPARDTAAPVASAEPTELDARDLF